MAIVDAVGANVVAPMHYRTKRIDWLEPVDAFAERFARVRRADTPVVDLDAPFDGGEPLLVVPNAP